MLEQSNREIKLLDVLVLLITNIQFLSLHLWTCQMLLARYLCSPLLPACSLSLHTSCHCPAFSSHRESGVFSPAAFSIFFTHFLNLSDADVNQADFWFPLNFCKICKFKRFERNSSKGLCPVFVSRYCK